MMFHYTHKVSHTPFADLTDVTLADEDDQILNECKWCHLVAQISTDAGGTTLWPKLQ